jgi:translation elongation factor aEF-1 beta
MADMIVGFRVMPVDGEVEYEALETKVKQIVENYHESVRVRSLGPEPVGFGLRAVSFEIQIDEVCGTEDLENKLSDLEETGEVSITKMDRL